MVISEIQYVNKYIVIFTAKFSLNDAHAKSRNVKKHRQGLISIKFTLYFINYE